MQQVKGHKVASFCIVMATESKPKSTFYVSKVTPSPASEQNQLDNSGEIENNHECRETTMEGSTESKKSCDNHVTSNSQDSCDGQVASKTKGQSTHIESTGVNTIQIEVPTLVNGTLSVCSTVGSYV